MYEPDMDFIRRIEVYKSSNPKLAVRVYHMLYGNSCEEHKYLAGLRKEKDAFEKLIKERSVIVDMREFRSSLPSLLHASRLMVIPATLTVGDYILSPDICVERKSVPDLVSSFNSGRLYTQCETMTAYYKYPILLIEFEEDKSFSLDSVTDIKSYAKPSGKYPAKKNTPNPDDSAYSFISVQSKLVMLTLQFPRVRIIWSSSPYATSEIFNDLKMNNPEPDPVKAIAVGADDDPEAGMGVNRDAEEMLRCLPGVNGKNLKVIMNGVRDLREFCALDVKDMQTLMGEEAGWECWRFIHRGFFADRGRLPPSQPVKQLLGKRISIPGIVQDTYKGESPSGSFPPYTRPAKRMANDGLKHIEDVVEALLYLKGVDIVHGDIKGANVLISDDGRALLSDFGHARFTRGHRHTSSFTFLTSLTAFDVLVEEEKIDENMTCWSGTVRWMAPELLCPEKWGRLESGSTFASDVFALGMLIYEIYSGDIPFFDCPTFFMVVIKIVQGHRPSSAAIPKRLLPLVEGCWAHDPLARPTIRIIRDAILASKHFIENT
ncbi:hypothetical protein CVT24_002708 [Panaeolus cyanescens]|uniref:Protein kinase domain-containing protein n=1 Tax=Panaeolus cyanescens TaxID=181874 RepID=A0A409WQ37_9AGAR|nr:hypothetical protein CVT24_002708 [Panaeolus cyanescens]